MSASLPSGAVGRPAEDVEPRLRDMSQMRSRRRAARRRRRLARLDLGFGVLGAVVLLLATPGLAIAALVALVLIAVCILSVALERRRSRRG
jgi:Flp pilus assembly protein TadB